MISFTYSTENGYFVNPKNQENFTVSSGKVFYYESDSGYAYKCNAEQEVKVADVDITFKDILFQPFYNASEPFQESQCHADESSSSTDHTLWIIVGSCAGGVLLIIVVALLVGCRKRMCRRGYEKV
jgi:hypothetical protein